MWTGGFVVKLANLNYVVQLDAKQWGVLIGVNVKIKQGRPPARTEAKNGCASFFFFSFFLQLSWDHRLMLTRDNKAHFHILAGSFNSFDIWDNERRNYNNLIIIMRSNLIWSRSWLSGRIHNCNSKSRYKCLLILFAVVTSLEQTVLFYSGQTF